jgi:hypothetical protein
MRSGFPRVALAILTTTAISFAGACEDDDVSADRLPIPAEGLEALALTEEEGARVIPDLSIYPWSPPVGVVPNERFVEHGDTGDPALDRRLVTEFHRVSGYHGEYSSDSDDSLHLIIEMDLYSTQVDAHNAFNAIWSRYQHDLPNKLPLSRRRNESVGDEGRSLRGGDDAGWHTDVVLFRRVNLVVAVAVADTKATNRLAEARDLARILDQKASATVE